MKHRCAYRALARLVRARGCLVDARGRLVDACRRVAEERAEAVCGQKR